MTTSTENPAARARARMLPHTSGSLGQYNWNQRGPFPDASATSSMLVDDAVDITNGSPRPAAALALARSASLCTMD